MPATPANLSHTSFDYALVRVLPRVERGEFVNVGAILFCRTKRFLDAEIVFDRARWGFFSPHLDLDQLETNLTLIPAIARGAGPIGALPLADRFHWLTAPRSTVIQPSPVHCGRCSDPAAALGQLIETMVR